MISGSGSRKRCPS